MQSIKLSSVIFFREIRTKENVDFLSNDTLLTYREPKAYVFDQEKSNGSESDNITALNLGLVVGGENISTFLNHSV